MGKEKQMEMRTKLNGPSWYLKPVIKFLIWFYARKTKINKINCENLKTNYLVFSNHASFIDFPNMAKAALPRYNMWVTSVEEFSGREWLLRHAGCTPKRKYTKDLVLLRNVKNALKEGKCNVIIYPEARYSLCGVPDDIGEALGKFAKFCDVPVVVFNQHGNFLYSPQFAKYPYRTKHYRDADFIQVATLEEVRSLTAAELQERIVKAFDYDDFKWQYDNKVETNYSWRAKNYHKVLYKCPCCMDEHHMDSYDNFIECKACGAKWDMDVYSRLHLLNEDKSWDTSFEHIPNWYHWEKECVRKEVEEGKYSFSDEVRVDYFVNAKKGFKTIGTCNMTQDSSGIKVEGMLDNGEAFSFVKPAGSTTSVHIEFDFKKRGVKVPGDAIELSDLDTTYFVFPKSNNTSLTKIHLATEFLYKESFKNNN